MERNKYLFTWIHGLKLVKQKGVDRFSRTKVKRRVLGSAEKYPATSSLARSIFARTLADKR